MTDNYFVTFRYSPERKNGTGNLKRPLGDGHHSPSKLPRLDKPQKSPSRSLARQISRTPTPSFTPPSSATQEIVEPPKAGKLAPPLLGRTLLQSLESMRNYKLSVPFEHAERIWYHDVQNVSQRLHYLREVYRAIQTLKKKKSVRDKSSSSLPSTNNPLEDEPNPQNFEEDTETDTNNSANNDEPSTPSDRRRRTPRA